MSRFKKSVARHCRLPECRLPISISSQSDPNHNLIPIHPDHNFNQIQSQAQSQSNLILISISSQCNPEFPATDRHSHTRTRRERSCHPKRPRNRQYVSTGRPCPAELCVKKAGSSRTLCRKNGSSRKRKCCLSTFWFKPRSNHIER